MAIVTVTSGTGHATGAVSSFEKDKSDLPLVIAERATELGKKLAPYGKKKEIVFSGPGAEDLRRQVSACPSKYIHRVEKIRI